MKRVNLFVAFAVGWTSAMACVWLASGSRVQAAADDAIHVCVGANGVMRVTSATANCPPGQQSLTLKKWAPDSVDIPDPDKPCASGSSIDPRRIADLEKLVKALEDAADHGSLSQSVVAPFEVVDRAGKRIFYVEAGAVRLYNAGGADVAHMLATNSGGSFAAKSSTGGLATAVGDGLRVIENDVERVVIGRQNPSDGSYSARFYTSSGQRVAAIGQSRGGQGGVVVADDQGKPRGFMLIGSDGRAAIGVQNAAGTVIGNLGEGDTGGGLLLLTNSSGESMVEAGTTEGGFGVVRAGPEGFKPGLGLLGLPGSYIAGKPK